MYRNTRVILLVPCIRYISKRLFHCALTAFIIVNWFLWNRSQRRRWPEFWFKSQQKTEKSKDCVHGPPVANTRKEFRETKVPERPGPHGIGGQAQSVRHTSQDLVSEQEVSLIYNIINIRS